MSSEATARMTLQEFLDRGSMSRVQYLVVALAFLTLTAEGLDITVVSFVYPEIVREWGTSLGAVTATVTLSVVSLAVGSMGAGPLADRYGRKIMALGGVALFAVMTAAMALTTTIGPFTTFRILACLGLGAAMPVLLTIVAESVPAIRRAQMVGLAFCGVAVGPILGGLASSVIIPALGWGALLLMCGLIPLLLVPVLARLVPEPPAALLVRGRPVSEARRSLDRLAPGRDASAVDFTPPSEADRHRRSVGAAVPISRRYALTTVLLWTGFFIGLGVVFLLLNYMPLMVGQQGFSAAQTGVTVAMFGWGGLVGQVSVSYALRRFDPYRLLALLWLLGLAGVWAVAAFTFEFAGFLILIFGLGLFIPGGNAVLHSLSAMSYPPGARATGMGWASAAGRVGTLATGLLGGLMLAAGRSISEIFLVMGIPVALGVVAALALRVVHRHRERLDRSEGAVPGEFAPSPNQPSREPRS